MDNGLVRQVNHSAMSASQVLILIVVDNGLVQARMVRLIILPCVLILIVVDNGLVQHIEFAMLQWDLCLNPYCSGQWSRTRSKCI